MKSIYPLIILIFLLCIPFVLNAQKKNSIQQEIIPQRLEIFDTLFEQVIHDPYRWMENLENDSLQQWIAQENQRTDSFVQKNFKRIYKEISDFGKVHYHPYRRLGPYYFMYVIDDASKNSSLHYTQKLGTPHQLLIDPNQIEKGKNFEIVHYYLSNDATKLAVKLNEDGSDWHFIKVYDIVNKKWLSDEVHQVKYSKVIWYGEGFFYASYPNSKQSDAFSTSIKNRTLFYHQLGTSTNSDKVIYTDQNEDVFDFYVNADKYLVLERKKVSDQMVFKNYFYTPLPLSEQIEFKSFFLTNQANIQTNIIGQRGDDLIIQSNFQEKNHAIYLLHPSVPNQVSILIPSTDGYIKNSWNFGENIIVEYQYQNEIYLSVYDFKGNSSYTLKIDDGAYISDVSGNGDEMIFSTTSFYSAPVFYQLDLKSLKLNTTKEIQLNYDPHLFVTNTVDYMSKDGTSISMYITHRKDLNFNDKHPTLLYGYGGFGISAEPFFHPSFIHFMQYGGILAVPKIRGGGDYPGWHDMGKRHQKQNSMDDFIAAAEYLNSNYTSPQQLAITGGSQGGLLVLSAMTQRPELFKAVIARSGLSDMIRYDRFNIGYSYKDEYGDPKLKEDFEHLWKYSPLHQMKQQHYPATLILHGMSDDRVHPFHSLKMQAEILNSAMDQNPHLIQIGNYGHCNCSNYDDRVEVETTVNSFLFKILNMESRFKKYFPK